MNRCANFSLAQNASAIQTPETQGLNQPCSILTPLLIQRSGNSPTQAPQELSCLIPRSILITVISSSMIAQFQHGHALPTHDILREKGKLS